jgi:phosphoribosylaminoimidazole-succinocarboxamide synthase
MKTPRPQTLHGQTIEVKCPCGKLYVVINESLEGIPFEVFVRFGKSGSCSSAIGNGLATVISIALRSGTEIDDKIKGLSSVSCHRSATYEDGTRINSCVDAIAYAAKVYLQQKPLIIQTTESVKPALTSSKLALAS